MTSLRIILQIAAELQEEENLTAGEAVAAAKAIIKGAEDSTKIKKELSLWVSVEAEDFRGY